MTQGFLIFAFNNGKLDYLAQAIWVANRIRKYLDKPTTIVTDVASLEQHPEPGHDIKVTDPEGFGSRNFDLSTDTHIAPWFNGNRYQAYAITPYDETIIIDSDYVVNSDQLNKLWGNPHEFLTHRAVHDVTFKNSFVAFDTFGVQIPHYWATVLYFRKSSQAEGIFDLISMIKANYGYYSQLYQFANRPYRNDFAVSIAQLIAYGHRIDAVPTIPWLLPTAPADAKAYMIDEDTFELRYEKWMGNKHKNMRVKIKNMDFHCLDKISMEAMING
jgi:hypothetical protein